MNTKRCGKCGQTKPVSEFFKSKNQKDGYRSRCKSCHMEDCKAYAQTGYYKRYNREYERKPEVRERRKLTKVEYRQRTDVRIKNMARSYTNHLIRAGKLNREPCAFCGKEQAESHHIDYTQPLIIVWLCADCHREIHINLKELVKEVK